MNNAFSKKSSLEIKKSNIKNKKTHLSKNKKNGITKKI